MKSRINLWILSFIFITTATFGQAQVSLERIKVNKYISMEVPASFVPMDQADLYNKYVSSRMPIAMYTSADRLIDLGINENSSTWAATDHTILQDFHKANILNLFDQVTFIQEEIKEIGNRTFVVFEFVSRVTDEESTFGGRTSVSKYTYIMYTIRNNRVLLFNFTCPARMQSEWKDTAREIMESIRIK